jgi:F0F1-type ATP synthase membrane subunit a
MTNLFSSFDPTVRVISIRLRLNWAAALIATLGIPQSYWLLNSQLRKTFINITSFLKNELGAIFGEGELPGVSFLFVRIFLFILFSNFMGLVPYIFTRTSHLSITLVLALPL